MYWKYLLSFYWWDLLLLLCFLLNQENLYLIHHNLNLFCDVCNTINEHNSRQTHYLSLITNYFDVWLNESKSYFITSSASSLMMISMLSLFECTTCSSSLSMEEIKLFVIVNWIFYVSDFLRLFMMLFEHELTLLRYSSSDSVLFLSPLLLYSI